MYNLFRRNALHTLTPFLLFCACAGNTPAEKPALPVTQVPAPATPAPEVAPPAAPVNVENTPVLPKDLPKPAPREQVNTNKTPVKPTQSTPTPDAQPSSPVPVTPPALPIEKPVMTVAVSTAIRHEAWNTLLNKHVSAGGKVDYKGFKEDKAAIDAYCGDLAAHTPQTDWSRAEKMAYWINVYNAFTVKLITDQYPLSSILKLDGGKTWDVKRIQLGDKKYSLNQIENEILRPQFKDPRIHVAINCAAKSCPPLLNKAYTAENLEQTLEERTRKFINNSQYNTISADRAKLSKIFEWYAADFPDLKKFVNQYSTIKLNASAAIEFKDYDWDLNQ